MKVRNLLKKIEQRLNELLVQVVELNISLTENNMREIKYRAYVKHLKIIIEVQRINFDCKTVE
jgi:hypothetical protein